MKIKASTFSSCMFRKEQLRVFQVKSSFGNECVSFLNAKLQMLLNEAFGISV